MQELLLLSTLFFLIAVVYSSAGFGGGSSYLAVLSFFGLGFSDLRMIALICNIVVVASSVFLFSKHKYLNWKRIIPLVLLSVPLAFLGGSLNIESIFFYRLLGFSLLLSAVIMILGNKVETKKFPKYSNALIGGGIGFLSGLVGIGGGVFLSPFLHLSKWDKPKVIAATSAAFILVNSIAGLIGQVYSYGFKLEWKFVGALVLAVILGGQVGMRVTLFKLDPIQVKRITAFVILTVAIRLLFKYI